jgi:hypothetical protein
MAGQEQRLVPIFLRGVAMPEDQVVDLQVGKERRGFEVGDLIFDGHGMHFLFGHDDVAMTEPLCATMELAVNQYYLTKSISYSYSYAYMPIGTGGLEDLEQSDSYRPIARLLTPRLNAGMLKPRYGRSFATDREFVKMAQTMGLNAIVKRTGRKPESIIKTALRLAVTLKGRPKPKVRPLPDAT